jgi:hypothetical protein
MTRIENAIEWVQVESLADLDALVGRYITGEQPKVHWEDSHAHMQFETVDEALEALREPYFQQFIPPSVRADTVLREVRAFLPYSSNLSAAWQVVQRVSTPRQALRIWQDRQSWCASFGDFAPVSARSESTAICLAALRVRGLEVALAEETESPASGSTVI